MQDYPWLLRRRREKDAHLVVTYPRFLAMSPVKNSLAQGRKLEKITGFAESAASGERDLLALYARMLTSVNTCPRCNAQQERRITVEEGAFVVLWPDAGCTVEEIHKHIGRDVVLKRGSVLIVQCCNWFLDHMTLEGPLRLRDDDTDPNGPVIRVTNCVIRNRGWSYYPISPEDESIPQVYRIRGYMVHRKEERVWTPQSQVPPVPSEP